MTLLAVLKTLPKPVTGFMEFTIATISTLAGLVEVEPGWVLCNGAVVPNVGNSPSGVPYAPLNALLGTNYGAAGTLPTLVDGVQPIGRGASAYPALNGTDGAASVVLTLAQISDHTQTWDYESTTQPLTDGWANDGSTPPFDDDAYPGAQNTEPAGGGGGHNNMPPYVVVEGMMVKL